MALMAIILPQSIWALMMFKFELLIQVAPVEVVSLCDVDRRHLNQPQ